MILHDLTLNSMVYLDAWLMFDTIFYPHVCFKPCQVSLAMRLARFMQGPGLRRARPDQPAEAWLKPASL